MPIRSRARAGGGPRGTAVTGLRACVAGARALAASVLRAPAIAATLPRSGAALPGPARLSTRTGSRAPGSGLSGGGLSGAAGRRALRGHRSGGFRVGTAHLDPGVAGRPDHDSRRGGDRDRLDADGGAHFAAPAVDAAAPADPPAAAADPAALTAPAAPRPAAGMATPAADAAANVAARLSFAGRAT